MQDSEGPAETTQPSSFSLTLARIPSKENDASPLAKWAQGVHVYYTFPSRAARNPLESPLDPSSKARPIGLWAILLATIHRSPASASRLVSSCALTPTPSKQQGPAHFAGVPGVRRSTESLENIDPESSRGQVELTLPRSLEPALRTEFPGHTSPGLRQAGLHPENEAPSSPPWALPYICNLPAATVGEQRSLRNSCSALPEASAPFCFLVVGPTPSALQPSQ